MIIITSANTVQTTFQMANSTRGKTSPCRRRLSRSKIAQVAFTFLHLTTQNGATRLRMLQTTNVVRIRVLLQSCRRAKCCSTCRTQSFNVDTRHACKNPSRRGNHRRVQRSKISFDVVTTNGRHAEKYKAACLWAESWSCAESKIKQSNPWAH